MQELPPLSIKPANTSFAQKSDSNGKHRKYCDYLHRIHFHYIRKPQLEKKH